jgi:hypothetical protein
MEIRKYREIDWGQIWPIIKKVFRAGETYAFSPEITEHVSAPNNLSGHDF